MFNYLQSGWWMFWKTYFIQLIFIEEVFKKIAVCRKENIMHESIVYMIWKKYYDYYDFLKESLTIFLVWYSYFNRYRYWNSKVLTPSFNVKNVYFCIELLSILYQYEFVLNIAGVLYVLNQYWILRGYFPNRLVTT